MSCRKSWLKLSERESVRTVAKVHLLMLVFMLSTAGVSAQAQAGEGRSYQVASFDRIYLNGNAQLHIAQVAALAQPQLVPVVAAGTRQALAGLRVESVDGTLYVDAGEQQDAQDLVIHLRVFRLKEVLNEGRGHVFADGLSTPALTLEGTQAGQFDLRRIKVEDLVVLGAGRARFQISGAAEHQFVDLKGVGRYHGSDLTSRSSQVNVSDRGQVDVYAEELLDIVVFGDATVRYSGKPWVITSTGARPGEQRKHVNVVQKGLKI